MSLADAGRTSAVARQVAAGSLAASLLLLPHCARSARTQEEDPFTPVLSVRELMEHMIDPAADAIFDSAVIDVSQQGITETIPDSDEDWLAIERGAMHLAEAANLLKMKRDIAPSGGAGEELPPGVLSPQEIGALVERSPARWNTHADKLRAVAVESLQVARARDTSQLFRIGGDVYKACENCHADYWYPRDRDASR